MPSQNATYQVAASSDDCFVSHDGSSTWSINLTGDESVGYYSSTARKIGNGLRFLNVNIPAGATILTAYIQVKSNYSWTNNTVNTRIVGEKVTNPATFSTASDYKTRRGLTDAGGESGGNLTTAVVAWDGLTAATWSNNYVGTSPSIVSIIQELVDQVGYTPNNPMVLYWDDHAGRSTAANNTCRSCHDYDESSTECAKLYVEWNVVPAVTSVAATNVNKIGAEINGTLTDNGGATTTCGFYYKKHSDSTWRHFPIGTIAEGGSFYFPLTALLPSTQYDFYAYATNSEGTSNGSTLNFTTSAGSVPTPLIITDNDLGEDWDDAADLANLNTLADQGECTILAANVCLSSAPSIGDNLWSAKLGEIWKNWYFKPGLAVGITSRTVDGYGNSDEWWAPEVLYAFAHQIKHTTWPDATTVNRQALSESADGSVTMIFNGTMSNLYTLFNSVADDIDSHNGADLMAHKIKELVIWTGDYPSYTYPGSGPNMNYDACEDLTAGGVLNDLQGTGIKVVWVGATCCEDSTIDGPFDYSPCGVAWRGRNAQVWGSFSVLYAVRGLSHGGDTYFSLSSKGYNDFSVDCEDNTFTTDAGENQYYLILEMDPGDISDVISALIGTPVQPGFALLTYGGTSKQPTKDAYLVSGSPTTNYGSATTLATSPQTTNKYRSVLEFDISDFTSPQSLVTHAAVGLYYYAWLGDDPRFRVLRLDRCRRIGADAWVEAETTWNIYKTGSDWGTAGCGNTTSDYDTGYVTYQRVPDDDNFGFVWFDVTDLFFEALDNSRSVLSLTLRENTEGESNQHLSIFNSRSAASNKVYLLVGSIAPIEEGVVSMGGTGDMSATPRKLRTGICPIDGVGGLGVIGIRVQTSTTTLSGSGNIAIASIRVQVAVVSIAGTGSIAVIGRKLRTAIAGISGVGDLSVSAIRKGTGTISMFGAGQLSGAARLIYAAKATLSGTGMLSGAARLVKRAAGTLSGTGGLSVSAVITQLESASVVLSGVGSLALIAIRVRRGVFILSGVGTVTCSAVVVEVSVVYGVVTFSGTGDLFTQAIRRAFGATTLTGAGLLRLSPVATGFPLSLTTQFHRRTITDHSRARTITLRQHGRSV
jgi:hypothetical protein